MIKSTLRVIDVAAHVPFANERRLISCLLQLLRKEHETRIDRVVIVNDSVIVSVLARQNGRAARRTERCSHVRARQHRTIASQ
jgi:hypothetical protein